MCRNKKNYVVMKKLFGFMVFIAIGLCFASLNDKVQSAVCHDGLVLANLEALGTPEVEVGPLCIWATDHICVAFSDEGLVILGYDYSWFSKP